MNSTAKAIFFDIDGTLINKKGGPYKDDLEAMEKAAADGHYLFLNTGRSFSHIPDKLRELKIWHGIAAGGGAHILLAESLASAVNPDLVSAKFGYKTFYHKWINSELLSRLCSWYLKNKKQLVLEGENDYYVVNPIGRSFNEHPVKIITGADDFSIKYADDLITKLTISGSIGNEEQKLLEDFFTINRFPDYVEAIIKGESKAKAISIILDIIGIEQKYSIAIGDGINDIDMISYAGLGIAMGDADERVKIAADAITGNCGESGVAEAIMRYVLC